MGVTIGAQGVQITYKLTFLLDFLEGRFQRWWSPNQVGRGWFWTRTRTSAAGRNQSKAI